MDSITQIALGAAVGEACLGRKIGNRALIWGGIAGTIPDLDVISSFFLSDFQATMFHRGPTHSLLFGVLWPFLLAWLVHKLYSSDTYQKSWYKWAVFVLGTLTIAGFYFGVYSFVRELNGQQNLLLMLFFLILTGGMVYWLWKNYLFDALASVKVNYQQWYWFFFWTTVTHTLLDCCTSYGTQLYWPFDTRRVSWDIISVADPFFTVPLVLVLIGVAMIPRQQRWRQILNWVGIGFMTLYFAWTIRNWNHVQDKFGDFLKDRAVTIDEMRTTPSILNNILWYGVARSGDQYYRGWYSLLDESKMVDTMFRVESQHHLVERHKDQWEVEMMAWFSDDFYHIEKVDDTLYHYDLRFGFTADTLNYQPQSVFGYKMVEKPDRMEIHGEASPREDSFDFEAVFRAFIKRVKGTSTIPQ